MLLAQWGQSFVRIPPLVTKDLPSFGQKLTSSSYAVEHCGHRFMAIILNRIRLSVKRSHPHSLDWFEEKLPRPLATCPGKTLTL